MRGTRPTYPQGDFGPTNTRARIAAPTSTRNSLRQSSESRYYRYFSPKPELSEATNCGVMLRVAGSSKLLYCIR